MTCVYEDCWEDNKFNQKSVYCPLHQKIIRNYVNDLFVKISLIMTTQEWNDLSSLLAQSKNIVSLSDLGTYIKKASGYNLSIKEKEFIYEVYKSQYDDQGNKIDYD